MNGRFSQPDVARDDVLIDAILEELADIPGDLLSEVRAIVVHREEDAGDVERWIERAANASQRGNEVGKALEREILACQRNQHSVGGDERVQRQQPERGWRVDEDEVEVVANRREDALQPMLAAVERDELDLGAGQLAVGWNQRQALDSCWDDRSGRLCRQGVINGARRLTLEPETTGEVRLRIEVDEEDPLLRDGERRSQVEGGRGLADTALLVSDGDYPRGHNMLYDLNSACQFDAHRGDDTAW